MASHEDHLQELKRRWSAVRDAVAAFAARWHEIEGEHPEPLHPDYGQWLGEVSEQHIPETLRRLDEMPSTDAGVQAAFSLSRSHLDQTEGLLAPPELAAELSVKEQSDVQTLHMRVLAAARHVKQYVDQVQVEDTAAETVIDQIIQACGTDFSTATLLTVHLICAQGKLRDAPAAKTPEERLAAERLAGQWQGAVTNITGRQAGGVADVVALRAVADDIEMHAQLVRSCQQLEAFAG